MSAAFRCDCCGRFHGGSRRATEAESMTDPDPTQTPAPDAALPGEVEAALARLSQDSARVRRPIDAAVDLATVEAHIADLPATPQTAEALPGEVEAAIHGLWLAADQGEPTKWAKRIRSHLAALTAERDALRVRLEENGCARCS